ncbi:hypothetical protein [Edwardsiella tarda]|uniref:hypothetical protein n=1 Tax=Edwardsiella tarda TaxID=636 RepID=UPI00351C3771
MKEKKIYVLVATMLTNLQRIDFSRFPADKNVFYLFSVQCSEIEKINDSLINKFIPKRSDFIVSFEFSKGLSLNRNALLNKVESGIAIIADDDVKYDRNVFDKIRKAYERNNADYITFMIQTPESEHREYKKYYKLDCTHTIFSLMKVSSIEITFDIESVKKSSVFFDSRFGLGSNNVSKYEESIFLNDLRKKGLKGIFIKDYLVTHPYESSGKMKGYKDINQVKEKFCYFFRYFGLFGVISIFIFLIKNPSTFRFGVNKLVNAFFYGLRYIK